MMELIGLLVGPAMAQAPTVLDCQTVDCAAVVPAADTFHPIEDKPYQEARDAAGEVVGWVGMSTDLVDINAYSGKPIVTVVGVDPNGTITGAGVLHHSEPILLVGIPEQELVSFVEAYAGFQADDNVTVGGTGDGPSVDMISGATVTVLAENRTILESARAIAADVGAIEAGPRVPGHFVPVDEVWTWEEMNKRGALGRLYVSQEEMGHPAGDRPFLDLFFTVVDPPQIGKSILGEQQWQHAVDNLAPDEHLLAIFNAGTTSFKGSGFVRGGLFDRVRVEQGLGSIMFRDLDYKNIGEPRTSDSPIFTEGGLFITRPGKLDPGMPFDMVFVGSRYDGKGGFSRDFETFRTTYRLPKSVYVLDGPDPESLVWRGAWKRSPGKVALVVGYLLATIGVFAGRRWTTAKMERLRKIHTGFMTFTFVVLGLWLHVQPSITQILTFVGSLVHEWRWGLFLSDPFLFVSWVFIALVTAAWGRGVFCGWVCPYGAMTELLYKAGRALKIPELELPDRVHFSLRYLRYVIFAVLLVVFLFSPETGEKMAEVEPFKSTFFVAPWKRHIGLFAWWLGLGLWAVTTYRPFCRYICPLGAALAIPSSVRISGPKRRDFCTKCKICTRGCEPRAIRPDGTIDPRECLNCWECEANYSDDQVCPPLVKMRRDLERAAEARHQK